MPLIKIERSEFSMRFLRSFIVNARSLFGRIECTEMASLAVNHNVSLPFTVASTNTTNTLETGGVVFASPTIHAILRMRGWTKVLSTIVERIAVSMVSMMYTKNELVHEDIWPSLRIKLGTFAGMFLKVCIPWPLRQPFEVGGIYESILALRERNYFVGWVCGLNDRMTRFGRHLPTLNRMVRFSPHYILGFALFVAPLSAQTIHSVKITWNDTVNPAGTTYNVYRASAACSTNPTLAKINTAPITTQNFTDSPVAAGTFCYAATAVGPGGESAFSNDAPAVILAPPNAVTITVTVQ